MPKMTYTPGPWRIVRVAGRPEIHADAFVGPLAIAYEQIDASVRSTQFQLRQEESSANADLLAAAPEMYAALKAFRANRRHAEELMDAAIARAEGR